MSSDPLRREPVEGDMAIAKSGRIGLVLKVSRTWVKIAWDGTIANPQFYSKYDPSIRYERNGKTPE